MKNLPRNAEYTKAYNKKNYLRLLREKPQSRAELARKLGITRAASSLIAEELLNEGFVCETAGISQKPGRTPLPLAILPGACFAVGIDLNRDGCSACIADLHGELLLYETLSLVGTDGTRLTENLAREIKRLITDTGIKREKIVGIGVSAAGPLDPERGRILNPPRFKMWHQTDIAPLLTKATGLPAYLENNAAGLARFQIGKAPAAGSKNFLLLVVDSGIGSGMVSGGRVLTSAGGFTGEIGHISISFSGKPCACGNRGCLETYASVPALLQNSRFSDWKTLADSSGEEARQLILQEAVYLSAGITSLSNLVSIDTVLLAGDIVYHNQLLQKEIEKCVAAAGVRQKAFPIRVGNALCDRETKLKSAAEIAFDRFLTVV